MAEKVKDQPKRSRDDPKRAAPVKQAPDPPPRHCAEAPAPNPNGDTGKGGKAS